MQKTIVYLLLLLILGAGVYYFVFTDDNAFGNKEAGFSVKDTSSVGRLYLVRTNGTAINVQRTDSGWMVNDQYRARQNTVNNLLWTIKNQFVQFPVPENAHNNVVKSLAGTGVKVEVYDRKGKLMRKFYVGNEAHNYTGSYMLLEGAQRPYVVQVPGVQGYPTPFYTTQLADWRDRSVFDLEQEDIKSVTVRYASEPLNSFTVAQNGKAEVITEPGIAGQNALNEKRANAYLKFFSDINCEGFLNGLADVDSAIGNADKYCTITLTSKKNRQQQLDVYYVPINKRSKNLDAPTDDKYDADRYYGVTNNYRDTVLMQQGTIGKLFRKAWEFYQPDQEVNASQPQ